MLKMGRQRGLILYAALAALVVIGGASLFGYVQTQRLASCRQEFQAFQAQVKAIGDAAEIAARKQEASDKAKKEKIDRENIQLRRNNAILAQRMRDNAGRSVLPAAAPGSGRPDAACFQRTLLDDALRKFTQGTAGIAIDGDAAVTDLDSARKWAAER